MGCGCKGKKVSKPLTKTIDKQRTVTNSTTVRPVRVLKKQQVINTKPVLAPNRKLIVSRKRV